MAESITISQLPPPFKSMQYELLRAEGLKFLQDLSGRIWTDYNEHDPGVTILEVLSYAITDLGYRTNYNIKDILTTNPNGPAEDIKNFFPAKEIMPNYPVTINDYRKLMIDVEIPIIGVAGCDQVGVKNAWIEKSKDNEIPFYVDSIKKTLTYTQPNPDIDRQLPKVLYDILLQFDECEGLGDLNENTESDVFPLYLILSPALPATIPVPTYLPAFDVFVSSQLQSDLNGINVEIEAEFPRWDTPGVDWDDFASIRSFTKNLSLKFVRLPEQYKVDSYGLRPDKSVFVSMVYNIINTVDTSAIEFELDKFIYNTTDGLIVTYQKKVKAVLEIIRTVKARLMANRNLGEDFFRFNAIKVEEILLCADIELETPANIEQVQAEIFHQIERFLSPTVFFYTLQEMYGKGKTTDQIFEGPRLDHGFIDDNELTYADRKKVIHVSDLISIIMDIPGVIAVKSIQIANLPLDNDDNIKSHAVKWCLDLAIDFNYIPLLSTERSTLTFFKDQLPYRANDIKAQAILDELEAADRPQKQGFPSQDIPMTPGEYKDIENYYTIQEEFPIVYGVGSPGLPATATVERHAQAKQLKAFLLFFDQLLADYLSQLFHVKDLFSMNEGKDINGDPIINKTYFTQSLMNNIPDGLPLYVNEANPALAAANLQAFAEDQATYDNRRNRFLDHLMARFAESFADYAMVVYKIDGPKAPAELIEDKLEFLNNYPLISSARDTGFNYKSPCELWYLKNISGLERRVEFLTGVDTQPLNELAFGINFEILPTMNPDDYYLSVLDNSLVEFMTSPGGFSGPGFPSTDAARGAMELLIVNAVQQGKYAIYDLNNLLIPDPENPPIGIVSPFHFTIECNGQTLGISKTYPSLIRPLISPPPPDPNVYLVDAINLVSFPVFENEFYNNPESNRYNFECFMDKYVKMASGDPVISTNPVLGCPDIYTYHFTLIDGDVVSPKTFLTGELSGLVQSLPDMTPIEQALANKDRLVMDMLRSAADFNNYRFAFDPTDPTIEVFKVVDNCGDLLGISFEEDFNQYIQDIMVAIMGMGSPNDEFQVVASTGNDGQYLVTSITVDLTDARRLKVLIDPSSPVYPIPDGLANGYFRIDINSTKPTLQPTVLDANTADNYFTVDKSLSRIIFPGEKIQIDSGVDQGEYVVVKVVPDGLNSRIYVKEKIFSTNPGTTTMSYTKLLPITAVDQANDLFYITPGADEVAAKELADWVRLKFFSHEGMHVVEHILLRPKYNGSEFVPVTVSNGLKTAVTVKGSLTFLRNFGTYSVNQVLKQFTVFGDYALELPVFSKLIIIGSTNAGTYTVYTAVPAGLNTVITVYENIPDVTFDGTLQFSATKPITGTPAFDTLVITDTVLTHEYSGLSQEVFITGSGSTINNDLGVNDGMYKIDPAIIFPSTGVTTYTITLLEKKVPVRDNFLPIDVDNDCGICRFDEPYSFIVSVVLPAWQGRFVVNDFRRFFERTLRLECPAHLVLNVCWVDCKQMGEFEFSYKKWLVENAKEVKDQVALSSTLNELLEVLVSLRSVYPTGTLHDCETDDTAQNSIILNNSIIGTL